MYEDEHLESAYEVTNGDGVDTSDDLDNYDEEDEEDEWPGSYPFDDM